MPEQDIELLAIFKKKEIEDEDKVQTLPEKNENNKKEIVEFGESKENTEIDEEQNSIKNTNVETGDNIIIYIITLIMSVALISIINIEKLNKK